MQTSNTSNSLRTLSSPEQIGIVEQRSSPDLFREVESPVFEDSTDYKQTNGGIQEVMEQNLANPSVEVAERSELLTLGSGEEKTQELYCFDCKKRFFSLGNSFDEAPACTIMTKR